LYYRLNTFQVEIPPLRERREDIPALVQRFVKQFAARHGLPAPKVQPEALERLRVHSWPGNIRELQNAIEYAVVLADAEGIGLNQLPVSLQVAPALHNALEETGTASDLESRERQAVLQVLIETGGNKKRAAEILGIQRPTLYAKLRRYGVH